jgi:ribosomal protein S18 acetylase RimI-like enzyme
MLSNMEPCQATFADYEAILASLPDFWGERDVRHLHHPIFIREFGDTALVIRGADGEVAAYLLGFVAPTRVGYVHAVAVRRGHRGSGLARQLYGTFGAIARERGAEAIKAITTPTNHASLALHRSLGMRGTEDPDYAGSGQARIVFWRELVAAGES